MEKYTSPTRYCNVNSPSIKEKAEELDAETPEQTAKNTFYFVRDEVQYNIRRKLKGAEKTLKTSEGMCFDKTNLFIALLRANDIPARYKQLKCELKVKDKDLPANALHIIAEINIDKNWVIQDPSFDPEITNLIETSEWNKKTWRKIEKEKTYEELPIYLPYITNYGIIKLSPKIKKIQKAIDNSRS